MYHGTEGASKNLGTFLKIINRTVGSRIATVGYTNVACTIGDSTLVQPSIGRLYSRRFDSCTTVESTLV